MSRPTTVSSRPTIAPGGAIAFDNPLRVNFENVLKQGILSKKGSILRLYNNECMFYLEKRVDGCPPVGPFLKFGPKKKPLTTCVDLGPSPNGRVRLQRVNGSRTKFQIITNDQTLKLKAGSNQEREQWMQALSLEIGIDNQEGEDKGEPFRCS